MSSKDAGPAFPDPRAEAREYLASTGCLDLFQELGTLLMYHKPDDPRAFLVEQLKKLQETQKTETLGSSIFSEADVRTMFGMFDPTGKGKIARDQCKQGAFHVMLPLLSISVIRSTVCVRALGGECINTGVGELLNG